MRSAIGLVLFLCGATAASVPAQAADATPAAALEQCVRDNAAKVEAAMPDLNQAVEFLVQKVCAEPVARLNAQAMRVRQQDQAARMKAMCDKRKSQPRTDDANKTFDLCAMQDYAAGVLAEPDDDDDIPSFMTGNGPPSAVALASRLLLDLRISHQKSGSTR
jgi:hypothetical protein